MPMRPIDLLDAKDLSKLSAALRELRQVEIYKTLGSLSVTARTLPGGKTRTVAMIVQVRTSRPGRDETVNCESMEQLQQLRERRRPNERTAGTVEKIEGEQAAGSEHDRYLAADGTPS